MLNSVAMTGRLTRDVDLRYTQSGTAVGSFTLAVDRQFKSKSGERETDFVNCQVWRKSAENFTNFTHKGALVGVQGRIQTRTYDDKDGKKVFVTEVIVDNFALLEPKQTSHNNGSPQRKQSAPDNINRARTNTNNQFANNGKPISVGDSDLPF